MKTINELCDIVRQTSWDIHVVYHGHGHLEKVYENALVHRLRKLGLEVKQQHPITVLDEDGTVGEFYADLFVDHRLLVELKAVRAVADEHVAQLLGYLKSTRLEHGVLINFGSYRFQIKNMS